MSAFACEPGRGSEQEVGWKWALEMSRWFDVTVITQTRNQPGIEKALARDCSESHQLRFVYFQYPGFIYRLKSRFDHLTWPYYFFWQISISRLCRQLHDKTPFDLAHHVTFVSFRVPVWLRTLNIPVVFGPVGGAELAPLELLKRGFGPIAWCNEVIRNTSTVICELIIRLLPPIKRGNGLCLAATPAMKKIFTESGLPSEVLPAIGIELPTCKPRKLSVPFGFVKFLFVGRLHPIKGVHLLLDAFALAKIPNATLTIIGAGTEKDKLRNQAKELGIDDKIHWMGALPHADLPRYYGQHHVLVAPSLYESGGLTVLEGMAEGLAIIATDVGGHSSTVTDESGIKIKPDGTADEVIGRLSTAMKLYASNTALIQQHGHAARERVASTYCWKTKALKMKAIYHKLHKRYSDQIGKSRLTKKCDE